MCGLLVCSLCIRADAGIRDASESRGLGDVYETQAQARAQPQPQPQPLPPPPLEIFSWSLRGPCAVPARSLRGKYFFREKKNRTKISKKIFFTFETFEDLSLIHN